MSDYKTKTKKLNKKHKLFITDYALTTDKPNKYFAEKYNVSLATVSRWVYIFSEEIATELQEQKRKTREQALRYGLEAFEMQVALMRSAESEKVKLAASKFIIELMGIKEDTLNIKTNNAFQIILQGVADNSNTTKTTND